MSSRFPQFLRAPSHWPEHLNLIRQWAMYVGTERAFAIRVLALSQLWPAKPFWIGVGTCRDEDASDAPPYEVLYIPLNLYAKTIAALLRTGPHPDDKPLIQALRLEYPNLEALLCALEGFWEEPSAEVLRSAQRNADLRLRLD